MWRCSPYRPLANAIPADTTRTAIIGDSLTRGYGVNVNEAYASLLEARAPGDNILPLAHDGATVKRWLTVYRPELAQLLPWGATTVVIALGGNDWYTSRGTAEYQAQLTELVTQVRVYAPTARVILWHYYQIGLVPDRKVCDVAPCNPVTPAPTWTQYGTAMRNVAVLLFTGYIDNSVEQQWLTRYPLPNENPHVHLSYLGHRALEQSIYTRLYNCC